MVDLVDIAQRLDADEKLKVTYRLPLSSSALNSSRGQHADKEYEVRTGRLLDVAEEAKLLYVAYESDVIWIKVDEVLEIARDET